MKNLRIDVNKKIGIQTVHVSFQKGTIHVPWPQISNWLIAAFIFTVSLSFKAQEPIRQRSPQPSTIQRSWQSGTIDGYEISIGSYIPVWRLRALLAFSQFAYSYHGHDSLAERADTGIVRPMQRGYFHFHNVKMSAILRELERWYDVKIIITECVENRMFSLGRIARKEKITKPLTIMALMGSIHYTISMDGKTVFISK